MRQFYHEFKKGINKIILILVIMSAIAVKTDELATTTDKYVLIAVLVCGILTHELGKHILNKP